MHCLFFFNSEEVDMNVRRRDFWQKYIGSMEQTIVILDRDVYKTMENRYKHAESDARRAFEMARVFRQASKFHALIMIFENVVAIEFHDTGAACLVVPRHVFDEALVPLLVTPSGTDSQECAINDSKHVRSAVLKHRKVARRPSEEFSWPHSHTGWEKRFLKKLGDDYGIKF
ncbi:MAG: hypothetical protein EOP06_24825 [Proteobacteria bacterium]|nr:MAG: hypothetical protein EOP06_24825 [Pseudomonadota bacterium]